MIGGFEQPSEGTVLIDGRPMNGVPAYRRPVNMVFQHYALFPHLDVHANVSYGLRQTSPAHRPATRSTVARLRRWNSFASAASRTRRIHEMSGGQQQRVALARAIVNRPSVLLLDEPLAALDRKLRTAMQIELQSLQRELGITFLLVTHDQEEALSMSDLVCVMNAGRIVQMAPPQEVYDRPATLFVADFVGKTNRMSGAVEADGATLRLADGGQCLSLPERTPGARDRGDPARSNPHTRAATDGRRSGTVTHRIFLGNFVEYAVATDGLGEMLVTADRSAARETRRAGRACHARLRSGEPAGLSGLDKSATKKKRGTCMTKIRTTPITAAELTAEFMRLKRGSVTRRHFLGCHRLGGWQPP